MFEDMKVMVPHPANIDAEKNNRAVIKYIPKHLMNEHNYKGGKL